MAFCNPILLESQATPADDLLISKHPSLLDDIERMELAYDLYPKVMPSAERMQLS